MARRGRENFRFTTIELVALAVSYTATSVLVFLLGFYVGRRVAAEHGPVAENVARVPVGVPPTETAAPRPASRVSQTAPASSSAINGTAPAASAAAVAAQPPTAGQAAAKPMAPGVAPPPAPPVETAPSAPSGVPFTVQVLATRNRTEANALTADLKRKGFGAYVAAVEDAGGTWYRVRIGHFDNADAARRTAERASREHGLTQAYVSPIYSDAR